MLTRNHKYNSIEYKAHVPLRIPFCFISCIVYNQYLTPNSKMYFLLSKIPAFASLIVASIIGGIGVQQVLGDAVDASTLEGKFLFGYQGFFRRPGQGNDHWTITGSTPGPSSPGDGKESLPLVPTAVI